VTLSVAALGVLGLTFGLGVLAGKHWSDRRVPPAAALEDVRKAPAGARRTGLTEPIPERARANQEKLTFYQTLTAPLGETPLGGNAETAAKPAATSDASKPPHKAEAADRAPRAAEPIPANRVVAADNPAADGRPAAERRDPSAGWAVQVGVFRNAQQAERIRKGLADSGFPAHLTMTGDDGQSHYRVRVGAFKTRDEALKVAERLRADRSLPTYVTNN
jgi:cell division protein FtsN